MEGLTLMACEALRIAPTLSSSHFLRGSPEMDLEPGQGPGLRTVFVLPEQGCGLFPLTMCAFLVLPTSSLCTPVYLPSFLLHCLTHPIVLLQRGWCKERAGGGPVRVFASPDTWSALPPLSLLPTFERGHSQGRPSPGPASNLRPWAARFW